MSKHELAQIAPYFVSTLLAFIGLWFIIRPQTALGVPRLRMDGFSPSVQERLQAAVARRAACERVGSKEIRTAGVIALTLSALVLARVLSIEIAFPLFGLTAVPILALGFMRSHNAARTRAATLQARAANGIPLWQLVLFAGLAFAPLTVPFRGHGHLLGASLACIAALAALACSFLVARAPSVMSADDPQVDAFVDDRLRALRTQQCAVVGFISAYFFIFLATLRAPDRGDTDVLLSVAQLVNAVGIFAVGWAQRPPRSSEVLEWFT